MDTTIAEHKTILNIKVTTIICTIALLLVVLIGRGKTKGFSFPFELWMLFFPTFKKAVVESSALCVRLRYLKGSPCLLQLPVS
jgi:hypothetical protein